MPTRSDGKSRWIFLASGDRVGHRLALAAFVIAALTCAQHSALADNSATVRQTASWPTVSGSHPIGVADLLALGDIEQLFPSPDATAVAFQLRRMNLESNRYDIGWYLLDPRTTLDPVFLGDGGELTTNVDPEGLNSGVPALPLAAWSPDGRWIAYLRRLDGEAQIWRSNLDGSVEEQVTSSDSRIVAISWHSPGVLLFLAQGSRSAEALATQRHNREGFLWDDYFFPGFSARPLTRSTDTPALRALDLATKLERSPTADERRAYEHEAAARDKDSRVTMAVRSPSHVRTVSLVALDPTRQGFSPPLTVVATADSVPNARTVCRASACTGQLVSIYWRGDERAVYFLRREGNAGSSRVLYEWQIGSARVRQIYATENLIDGCQVVASRFICFYETPTAPRAIVSIEPKTGVVRTLFDPNPAFKASLTAVQKLEWRDAFANDTFAHLVYPAGYREGARYPLVIVQYRSRGFLRGGVGGEYPVHVLAAQGFFVLSWDRPDFRDIAAKYSALEAQRYSAEQNREHVSKQSALETVIDYLAARQLIDPARVGITGLSDGAETVRVGLIHSNRFAAAVVSQAPGAPLGYYLLSERIRSLLRPYGLVTPDGGEAANAFWSYTSLAANADKISAPLLILVNESEMLDAAQTIVALQEAGKTVEAYVYPNALHIKNLPSQVQCSMERSIDWFNFWLRGAQDDVPAKAEQYQRWRKLRDKQEVQLSERASRGEPVNPLSQPHPGSGH